MAPAAPPLEPPAYAPALRLDGRSPSPPARRGGVQSTLSWVRSPFAAPSRDPAGTQAGGGEGSVQAEALVPRD